MMETKRKSKKERKKKLGVIVPYRKREEHLYLFKRRISNYLKNLEIPFEVFIINQWDDSLFNRGKLLNIGFFYAVESNCDYVVFHDVDMLPDDVDYSYSEIPIHLATNFIDRKSKENVNEIFDEYFGGVTMFTINDFKKINGYSNKYWGWGYEDTDLLHRCKIKNLQLCDLNIKNLNRKGTKLKLNGIDAYIKCKNFNNLLDFNSDMTLFISFCPNETTMNHTKERDDFTIFSIEGYNTTINFNSFLRYNFCTFDNHDNPLFINTKIKTNYQTNITITFDSNKHKIKFYQDGVFVSELINFEKIRSYITEQVFYLGCSKIDKKLENHFNGYFDRFALYSKILDEKEIIEISQFESTPLIQNQGNYLSANKLKMCLDSNFIKEYKLIDLSGNGNEGEIVNCEIVDEIFDEYKTIKIPHRRNSTFLLQYHEPNGYMNNSWKDYQTRWNQLRYHNEIYKNPELIDEDGLNNLEFSEIDKQKENNISFISVKIV